MEKLKLKLNSCEYHLMRFVIAVLKWVNTVLKLLTGFSLHSGSVCDNNCSDSNYEKCVHVQNVLWRAIPSQLSKVPKDGFLLSHESYQHPNILLKVRNTTLMVTTHAFTITLIFRTM